MRITEQNIYVDILFLVNFSMDYLCLYITGRILNLSLSLKRLLIASALGGVYSVLSLFLPFSSSAVFFLDIAICVIISAVVFHRKKHFAGTLLSSLLYFTVSMTVGGVMTALFNLLNKLDLPFDGLENDSLSVWGFAILAIAAGVISIFGGNYIFKKKEIRDCTLTLTFNKKTVTLDAFSDSGNLLCDAISGKPVIIVDKQACRDIVDQNILDDFLRGMPPNDPAYSHMRITPVHTVSGKSALVILRAEEILITYQKNGKTCTFSPDALFALGEVVKCQAVIPYSLFRG